MRTLINRPDLLIIREYVKQGSKKSFKSLYFIIDHVYKEALEGDLSSALIRRVSSWISAISTY